ncbi:hypothetical protein B5X24_HaOG212249 [Helicoverpa armigera]|uniref:Exportin-2 n=1 Tax=Helicoverpa armigera TaxID=29058 RepID=A0A2W1BGI3_HELAM|nr:hypothetical protein B5X24_HaOG212249 [Helicoverpa armigera]
MMWLGCLRLNCKFCLTSGVVTLCECAALYALKYEEEFGPHAPSFVTSVWTVLLATGPQPKYDALVSNALTFLAKIAEKNNYKSLFEDPATLSSICEKVVIPNMEFRESDMELFEDNPEEYVRRDIEGSDVDTRRRAACDLVRTLAASYEDKMMNIFGQYVQLMLAKYAECGASAWRGKDAAMYLVTSLASRGSTQAAGVTRASPLVDLAQFATTHVLPELQRPDVNELPVLKADAIKYVMTFRSLLPKDLIIASVPLLISHVRGRGVVQTYGACALEKLIAGGMLQRAALQPHAAALLAALHWCLRYTQKVHTNLEKLHWYLPDVESNPRPHTREVGSLPTGPPRRKSQKVYMDNIIFMYGREAGEDSVLRTLSCLQDGSLSYLGDALPKLAHMLSVVAKNPCKPHFNHYLFETLSLAVSLVTKSNPDAISAFEDALFPIFQEILQNDVQAVLRTLSCLQDGSLSYLGDALPKLAHMLSVVAKNPCKPHFNHYLFETLSLAVSLVTKSNPDAISAFEDALFPIFQEILQNDVQEFMPYVFQMLSLLLELRGGGGGGGGGGDAYSALLPCVVAPALWERPANVRPLVRLLCAFVAQRPQQVLASGRLRLSSSKTTKYVRGLIAFLGFYAAHFGADPLIDLVDSVQAGMFGMYVERVLIADLQRVSGALERKAAAVGCVKLLTDSQHFLTGNLAPLWPRLLQSPGVLPPRLAALDEPHRNALHHYLAACSVQLC